MNNAATQSLDNMPCDPPLNTLKRIAGQDYIKNLPGDFWSPVFGQPENRGEAYNFDFERWQRHLEARKMSMRFYIAYHLSQGGTILESFSDMAPTVDFTEPFANGCADTLWRVDGVRRLDKNGVIQKGETPFLPEYMNAEHLADHLTNRVFGFGMRVATWLESEAA